MIINKLNKKLFLLLLINLSLILSCQNAMNQNYSNHLKNESSPYLLMHKNNPVDWYPWNDIALKKAINEEKLIIISIGYAACHWCHVMEEESFSDLEVADLMNESFVSIKIDREERPDLDLVFMDVCNMLTGRGGWPLNVIALPDGRPIYAGTYFNKRQWMSVLNQLNELFQSKPEKLEEQAISIQSGINKMNLIQLPTEANSLIDFDADNVFNTLYSDLDSKEGGLKSAPKFPMPTVWNFILDYAFYTNEPKAEKILDLSLSKMFQGGIYDQIGGGFSRYATDSKWKVPHFEKMLYDNAQLVSLYSKSFLFNQSDTYLDCINLSLAFVKRELAADHGGFYSSLDADSEGEEGKFYIWTAEEIDAILTDDLELIKAYYSISKKGNWEDDKNILYRKTTDKDFAKKHNLSIDELSNKIHLARRMLLEERNKRIRPALDDKIICSWNALMLKAFVDAYRATNDRLHYDQAELTANFIHASFIKSDYRLDRIFKNGRSSINAFLDDYVNTINAFIGFYQISFELKWLAMALELSKYCISNFQDSESAFFFYNSNKDPKLISRKMELSDNVIPSSNSQMALNLYLLGTYFDNQEYINKSKQMLSTMITNVKKNPAYYSNWASLALMINTKPLEVAIVGKDLRKLAAQLNRVYLPNLIIMGSEKTENLPLLNHKYIEGETYIYVCKDKMCKLPVLNVKDAINQINEFIP